MPDEARLERAESGLKPASEGWFVVNVGDAAWAEHEAFGSGASFESREFPFRELGININVLKPGQPLCLYHEENAQEDFLVLGGEAVLLVEGEERPLRAWDFVHCPPGTQHVIVGAGAGLTIVLAVGTRPEDEHIRYPTSELAERHGAGAEQETTDPQEAYARWERPQPRRPDYWAELPWS
ncbi:MAG TPA: cupin domain-containing protein [Gaiellaceae bacterium]|nr:cupin domain-containing protein [Gaiellaceae bacterium]